MKKLSFALFLLAFLVPSISFAYELGSFNVLSNNHSNGTKGMYFNFDIGVIDEMLDGKDWSDIKIEARNHSSNKTATVVLWRSKNGGSHNGHGRWESNAAAGQWRIGDKVSLHAKGKFKVLSINHADNTIGKYFNFSVDTVDSIMNTTSWTNKTFRVLGSGRVGNVVLWRTKNGGGPGNGHGRWNPDSLAKPGQWRINDTIIIF